MRVSKEYYLMFHPQKASGDDVRNRHFSADLLWGAIKSGLSLGPDDTEHARYCRDCRDFVEQVSAEARKAGFSFPELLPEQKRTASA